jgi:hypothetical protein
VRRQAGDVAAEEKLLADSLECALRVPVFDAPKIVPVLKELAVAFQARGRLAENIRALESLLVLQEGVGPEDNNEVGDTCLALACCCFYEASYTRAELLCKRALAIREKNCGEHHVQTGIVVCNLLWIACRQNRYVWARELLQRLIDILESCEAEGRDEIARRISQFARSCRQEGWLAPADWIAQRVTAVSPEYGRLFREELEWPASRWN